jgi:hypothetical protein
MEDEQPNDHNIDGDYEQFKAGTTHGHPLKELPSKPVQELVNRLRAELQRFHRDAFIRRVRQHGDIHVGASFIGWKPYV